jgi:hypothetical protein
MRQHYSIPVINVSVLFTAEIPLTQWQHFKAENPKTIL